jgi:cytochrome c biogenesis protein CcmG/thiol:disulfide interchange protein DsbE
MRRLVIPAFVALLAAVLVALLAFGVSRQGENTSIDTLVAHGRFPRAPGASMRLAVLGHSTTESLAELRGKVVVLNVFASWCEPCKAEAPILEREQRVLLGHDGTVLGVTYLDNSNDSEAFVRQEHITYPVVRDVSGNFVRGLGASGVPETFVIDRRGRIVAVRRYQLAGSWLASTVARVLARSA